MTKFKDGMIGPSVILVLICFVITLALAGTYEMTLPVIEESEKLAAEAARGIVLESADSFTQITDTALPEGIMEAYRADNGSGYVFKAGAKGFDGVVTFMVGMDAAGNYVGIQMFDHNETPGLGTKIGEDSHLSKFIGKDSADPTDVITGATKTSNALLNTLDACTEAYTVLEGN